MNPSRFLRTISFRLAALYAALFAASALLLFVVIYWIVGDALRSQLATTVEREVAALVADDRAGGLADVAAAINRRLASRRHSTTSYLLLDARGRKLAGDLPARPLRPGWQRLTVPKDRDDNDHEHHDENDEDQAHPLIALARVLPDGGFLLVAEGSRSIDEVREMIIRAFAWALAVTLLLAIGGGTLLSVGFLRRIDAINRTASAIVDGQLARRVPTRGTGDELDRLARNLNNMLDRIEALMDSLRQVSTDIAHDLRTPLSRLRQRLETAQRQAKSVEDYRRAVDRALIDSDATLATFAALLRIAQIEAVTRRAAFSEVDLSAVFAAVAETYAPVAEELGHRLVAQIDSGIGIRGDHQLLMQMLVNLIENAIRHTPSGTLVSLRLSAGAQGPLGIVSDTGPGIPVGERKNVFARFYRLEKSRAAPGSGLGLALVAAIAHLHQITIELADNAPGLRVVLRFPPLSRR